jgi:putative ABC transport system substrate-binding protein
MDRRAFLTTLAGVVLEPSPLRAQPPGTIYRIGILSGGSTAVPDPIRSSEANLRALGYAEGRNLLVERRYAEGKLDALPRLVTELLGARVDLIVTVGWPAARAAKQATSTVPIMFSLATDPVEAGLVASIAHPGGNLTGFTQGLYVIKQVEVLREAVKRVSTVAYLHDLNYGSFAESEFDPLRRIGVRVEVINVKAPTDFEGAFAAASRARMGGLVVENSPMFYLHFRRLGDLGVQYRIPTIGHTPQFAEEGGLLAYGADSGRYRADVAAVVDKLLKGTKPSDIPIWQATKFDLSINLKTARALGISIAPSVLHRADQVVE